MAGKSKFTDEEVIDALHKARRSTVKGIAEHLSVSHGTVQVYLNKLLESGKLTRIPEPVVGKHPAWLYYEVRG